MWPASTPAEASAASAPACSRSVTKSLYFDTTTANRMPFADWLPSMMVGTDFFPMAAGPHPRRVLSLTTLEFSLTFFQERARAFAHVGGRCYQAEQRRLEHGTLGESHLDAFVDRR